MVFNLEDGQLATTIATSLLQNCCLHASKDVINFRTIHRVHQHTRSNQFINSNSSASKYGKFIYEEEVSDHRSFVVRNCVHPNLFLE